MIASIRQQLFTSLQSRFFYGWTMLGVSSLAMFASGPGQSHTFGVFIDAISEDLQIPSALIATAYGLATLAAAFLLPLMGRLVDRHGPRTMMIAVTIGLGLACILFGAAANFLWLVLGFGILRFLGQGSLMLNAANLVSQWFDRKRGFAMGLMALGFAASMGIHPPLGQWLLAELGWRQAWLVLGLLTWLLMLPPVLFLVYRRPEECGLLPDGDTHDASAPPADITGLSLQEALRTRAFYLVTICFFAISMLVTSLHFYQIAILRSHGLSADFASSLFPVSALVMVTAMPLVGRLLDRFATHVVLAAALLIQAACLILASTATSTMSALIYAAAFGLINAFSITLYGYLWPRYFGRKHVGSIQGFGQTFIVIGASLGPLPLGLAFDWYGNADLILLLLAVFPVLAAIAAALFLRDPVTPSATPAQPS